MSRNRSDIWREALRATTLGWDLALPIFGGVLVGYLLDRSLSTRYVFTLGLLIFGIGAGFYSVIRSIQRMDERTRRQDKREGEHGETQNEAAP